MAFVQSTKIASILASTLTTPPLAIASGNIIVALVTLGSGPHTLSSIVDNNSNTWVPLTGNPQKPNGQYNVYVYYCVVGTGGAAMTVTTTHNAAGLAALSIMVFSGRDTSSPLAFQSATVEVTAASSHTSAATGTLSFSGCDLICMAGDNALDQAASNEVYTATSTGWTMDGGATVTTGATTPTIIAMYKTGVGTASDQASWTNSNGAVQSGIFILALKAAAGGGSGQLVNGPLVNGLLLGSLVR